MNLKIVIKKFVQFKAEFKADLKIHDLKLDLQVN